MNNKTNTKNGINDLIRSRESKNFQFKPTSEFYKTVQIGQKRWGQIYRNEKPATIDELQRIATFFNENIEIFFQTMNVNS